MFQRLKARFIDIKTIKHLCLQAERHALDDKQNSPGAEHFLLAAFDLPDGTAQRVFDSLGTRPEAIKPAIRQQYTDALRTLGLNPTGLWPGDAQTEDAPEKHQLYDATASGREVMLALAANRREHAPLLGAHILSVIGGMHHGVAARALRIMGIDLDRLKSTADRIAANR